MTKTQRLEILAHTIESIYGRFEPNRLSELLGNHHKWRMAPFEVTQVGKKTAELSNHRLGSKYNVPIYGPVLELMRTGDSFFTILGFAGDKWRILYIGKPYVTAEIPAKTQDIL